MADYHTVSMIAPKRKTVCVPMPSDRRPRRLPKTSPCRNKPWPLYYVGAIPASEVAADEDCVEDPMSGRTSRSDRGRRSVHRRGPGGTIEERRRLVSKATATPKHRRRRSRIQAFYWFYSSGSYFDASATMGEGRGCSSWFGDSSNEDTRSEDGEGVCGALPSPPPAAMSIGTSGMVRPRRRRRVDGGAVLTWSAVRRPCPASCVRGRRGRHVNQLTATLGERALMPDADVRRSRTTS